MLGHGHDDEINVEIRAEAAQLATDLQNAVNAIRQFAGQAGGHFHTMEGHTESLRGKVHELRESWSEFGESMNRVLENVAPHLKEVLALSIAGAAAEMTHLVHESADAVRELQNTARVLGMTTDDLEAFELVGAQAGVSQNMLSRGLLLSSRRIGMVREEAIKATGNLNMFSGGVQVLSGGVGKLNDLMGGFYQGIGDTTTVFRASQKGALDLNKYFNHLILDVQQFPSTAEGMIRLNVAIAKSLMAIKDPTLQAAIGMRQFGRGYRDFAAALVDLGPKIDAAKKTIEDSGLGVSNYEKSLEKSFHQADAVMSFYIERVKSIFSLELSRAYVELFHAISTLIEQNGAEIRLWATQAGDFAIRVVRNLILAIHELHSGRDFGAAQWARDLVSFFAGLPKLIGLVVGAFKLFVTACDLVSAGIKAMTGYDIPGWALAAIVVLGELSGVLGAVEKGFKLVAAAINLMLIAGAKHPIVALLTLIAVGVLEVYNNWSTLKALATSFFDMIAAGAVAVVRNYFPGIVSAIEKVINKIKESIAYVKALIGLEDDAVAHPLPGGGGYAPIPPAPAAAPTSPPASVTPPAPRSSSSAAPPTVIRGHAGGGYIRGPGTSTSDSIRAFLSNGEYVVKSDSVSKYGRSFLDDINAGRFASGGFVGDITARRFASGGYVGAGGSSSDKSAVHLHLDGQSYGPFMAEDHIVGALTRAAGGQQLRSAGTKPSWFGGQA